MHHQSTKLLILCLTAMITLSALPLYTAPTTPPFPKSKNTKVFVKLSDMKCFSLQPDYKDWMEAESFNHESEGSGDLCLPGYEPQEIDTVRIIKRADENSGALIKHFSDETSHKTMILEVVHTYLGETELLLHIEFQDVKIANIAVSSDSEDKRADSLEEVCFRYKKLVRTYRPK